MLTPMSSRPQVSTAVFTTRSMSATRRVSAGTAIAVPPFALAAAAAASASSPTMSAATTRAPACASMRTVADPMFPPPPVTIATLFSSPNNVSAIKHLAKPMKSVGTQAHH
jgi:hypothetical protein